MTPITHEGTAFLMVKAPESGSCTGCSFQYEESKRCPLNKVGFKMCYDEHLSGSDDLTFRDDKIFIEDTPEALADYVTKTLEGSWDD